MGEGCRAGRRCHRLGGGFSWGEKEGVTSRGSFGGKRASGGRAIGVVAAGGGGRSSTV